MKKTLKTLLTTVAIATIALALNSCGNIGTQNARTMSPSEVVVSFNESVSSLDFERLATLIYVPEYAGVTLEEHIETARETLMQLVQRGVWIGFESTEIIREEISNCGTRATVFFRRDGVSDVLPLILINGQWKIYEEF